mmetsp:Transcript_20040/g.58195  ORF Transcript_20040/g.58195 Transcript_20040/m.58195 type:complete len:220 (-) Transcript_20040:103-762(-)
MLPARLDSWMVCRKSPASCSSSLALGILACKALTRSLAVAACVVAASNLSASRSEPSEASLSSSAGISRSAPSAASATFGRLRPRFVMPCSKARWPPNTSPAAVDRALSSRSWCFCCTRRANSTSKPSRVAFFCKFCFHKASLCFVHSSLAAQFCLMRSRRPNLWISRCSAMCACSNASMWKATASCLSRSSSNLRVTFAKRSCFEFGQVARSRCSKNL